MAIYRAILELVLAVRGRRGATVRAVAGRRVQEGDVEGTQGRPELPFHV